jgi:hypothetical protein
VQEDYPAPTPESLAKGKTIMASAAKALGGVEALRKVSNITERADVTLSMMGQSVPGKMIRYTQYPGNTRSELEVMGQKLVQVFSASANAGYQSGGGQSKDFEPGDVADARADQMRDLVGMVRNAAAYNPQWLGEEKLNGAPADVLLMSPEASAKFKVFVDRTTSQVVKMEYRGKSVQGTPVREELWLSDYRKAGSLVLPYKGKVLQDGQPFLAAEVAAFSWEVIPADKFKKPSS